MPEENPSRLDFPECKKVTAEVNSEAGELSFLRFVTR
jgi:hypothetical protein